MRRITSYGGRPEFKTALVSSMRSVFRLETVESRWNSATTHAGQGEFMMMCRSWMCSRRDGRNVYRAWNRSTALAFSGTTMTESQMVQRSLFKRGWTRR